MAAAPQFQRAGEATCSICLELFTDPVSIECGHSFCRSCITQCWEKPDTDHCCPQCRTVCQGVHLRPNWELRNIVEMFRLTLSPEKSQDEHLCPKHQQRLQLFCEEDHTLLCVICRESKEHREHTVCPIEEAAEEYKENYKNQTEKITSTFELLKQFLDKEKQQLLNKLEKGHEENMKKIQEKLTKLEISQSTHMGLITEVEEKCQLQDVHLLKDVKSILKRCDDVKIVKPEKDAIVEKTLQSIGEDTSLQEKLLELKATFPAELEWKYIKGYASTFHAELEWKYVRGFASAVTLDPDTAHRSLILSEDGRSVRHGDRAQDLPDTPQRFSKYAIVLGRERLSSGRHYWEVEVGDKTRWDLGVCDEAVSRKGEFTLSPKNGFWTMLLRDGEYQAATSPLTPLIPCVPPRAVGLFLDYEAGRLSLYNVDDRSLLFTFSGASFPPTLRPYFCPCTNKEGRNAGALHILPVTGRE
ncbi:E3 ubiquitin-protein ligase TRIM39-like isoform X2 [Pleurodeles waltl]|uniref:E3 ubiquitin-protein ligase TRIM39-like isoform X2 n=1 Tax=Pleurodeles waltl TaxID=8319 RepID=UPI00370959A7